MVLYLAVSQDKYELPVAVTDNALELSRLMGVSENIIYAQLSNAKKGKVKRQKYFRVVVEEE